MKVDLWTRPKTNLRQYLYRYKSGFILFLFRKDLAEEFRCHADIGCDQFLRDLIDDVRVCPAELLVALLCRQAEAFDDPLPCTHEIVLREDAEIPFKTGDPIEQVELVFSAEQSYRLSRMASI